MCVDVRSNIGVIFQDFKILATSIAENVLMRPITDKVTDELTVINALKHVGLYNKVRNLPNGIYTKLTKEYDVNGAIFSGGEFQKLAISRLYARKCNIIILDEPSSSLDPLAENDIFNSVLNLVKDKTVILISHRLTNIKNVDKIVVMENGEYAEMYNIQAEKYLV